MSTATLSANLGLNIEDATLRHYLADAELPSLLPALAYLLGDTSILQPELRPPLDQQAVTVLPQGGMTPEVQQRAREVAFDALVRFRDGGRRVANPADVREIVEFITGPLADDYMPMVLAELGLPQVADESVPSTPAVLPKNGLRVAIIGAGMSGIAAAYRLQESGTNFVVYERNTEVGGTWWVNTYPGCRLDTSNFAYSYSFAQRQDWPQQYSTQGEILEYFRNVVEEAQLRQYISFETTVESTAWSDEDSTWTLTVRHPDGSVTTEVYDMVISAVGQLNLPNYPDIPGIETFAGTSMHTATWSEDVELRGKRVAVIGTGASAFQVIPAIADEVGSMKIFQRTPPWMLPTPTYHEPLQEGLDWLFQHVPEYHRWYRFYQFWVTLELRRPVAEVDPDWNHPVSVSEANDRLRVMLTTHLEKQFSERPDILAQVLPTYPPYAKRMLRDNGIWKKTLYQDNVELIGDSLAGVEPTGIRTADGVLHEVDVIIYGTGFKAANFLNSLKVTGTGGIDLHEMWDGEARAFMGMAIPNFPNFFTLYGPNTNHVLNGSIIMMTECAVSQVQDIIAHMLETGSKRVEVKHDVHDEYNRGVDDVNANMAWGYSKVNSWYKNASGRVTQNWPHPMIEYWRGTHAAPTENFEFSG